MHPITAQLTNHNTSSQKLAIATGGQALPPLAIPTKDNQHKDAADSFQHFFETELLDPSQGEVDIHPSEPDISKNNEREDSSSTEVEPENIVMVRPAKDIQTTFNEVRTVIGQERDIKPTPSPISFDNISQHPSYQKPDQPDAVDNSVILPRQESHKGTDKPSTTTVMLAAPQLANTKASDGTSDPLRQSQDTLGMTITRQQVLKHQQVIAEIQPIASPNRNTAASDKQVSLESGQETTRQQSTPSTYQPNQTIDLVKYAAHTDWGGKGAAIHQNTWQGRSELPPSKPHLVSEQRIAQSPTTLKSNTSLSEVNQKTVIAAAIPLNPNVAGTKDRTSSLSRYSNGYPLPMAQANVTASTPKTPIQMQNAPLVSNTASQLQLHPDISKPLLIDGYIEESVETRLVSPIHQQFGIGRSELPLHVARQLAEVIQQMPSRPVEITLNPEELGRVRLSVAASENGIVVNVLAERPETLDLMRRHIDQLSQELQDLGYDDIAFSFAGAGSDPAGQNDDTPSEAHQEKSTVKADNTDTQTSQIHLTTGAAAGLDLRL